MVEHLDQESKLDLRRLRRANELFLRLLHAQRGQDHYDGPDDLAKSYTECLAEIRARVANGGPGWEPKP